MTEPRRTITEAELRKLVAQGVTHGEIAEMLGCARSSIANTCAVLGIASKRGVRRSRQTTSAAATELNSFFSKAGGRHAQQH